MSLALIDGTRLDACSPVSAGRASARTLWVFADGDDTFIPVDEVTDVRAMAPTMADRPAGKPPGPVSGRPNIGRSGAGRQVTYPTA